MSINVRKSQDRGHAEHGWLDSFHTFSFADYYDPQHMGFRSLRVINEDRVLAGQGFGSHPHKDMEIFSYVVRGSLKHKDSMGHESTVHAGGIQKISAGSGIVHSEFNASNKETVHFLQVWIVPQERGLKPSYLDLALPAADPQNPLLLIGSPHAKDKVVQFFQDVYIYRGHLASKQDISFPIKANRGVWIQMIKGKLGVENHILKAGDGVSIEGLKQIKIAGQEDAEFLLFDLV